MAERITSIQVAELAGVSQSAVSRVFTPGASVSSKTQEKVRKAATELGYRPNVLARAMVSGKSRIIGLVVAYLENYFYPEAVEKFSNALQERGYHVLIFMTSQTDSNIDGVMEEILDYQVDGIVMASAEMSSVLTKRCQSSGVPVVLFNRSQDLERISAVTSDNFSGGRKVAEFFVPEHKRPDAVFVANDHMAIAVMDVLRHELGLSVPGDVSLVGFDDVPPASWAPITYWVLPRRYGKNAA